MNTQLNLRVQKVLSGRTIDQGAIVEIRKLDEAGRTYSARRLAVPMGNDGSRHQSLSVDPGIYEISTLLPSGQSIVRTVEVTGNEKYLNVTFDGDSQQHGWSLGYDLHEELKTRSLTGVEAGSHTFHTRSHYQLPRAVALLQRPLDGNDVREVVWERLCDGLSKLGPNEMLEPDILFAGLLFSTALFDRIAPTALRVNLDPLGIQRKSRNYLVVKYHHQAMVCVMPWPWSDTHGHEVRVEAIISEPSDEIGSPWSIKTFVKDDMFSNLLDYFSAGEQGIARELLAPAKELLYYKLQNPLAATAGAYILLSHWIDNSTREVHDLDWIKWIENLNRLNSWLPDAAVLEGWLALRMRGNEPRIDDARRLLLQAERRGIPVYSTGVRRLVDGLMLLAGEARRRGQTDDEVDAALGRVRRLAWQIDSAQPFTCIRLWNL